MTRTVDASSQNFKQNPQGCYDLKPEVNLSGKQLGETLALYQPALHLTLQGQGSALDPLEAQP